MTNEQATEQLKLAREANLHSVIPVNTRIQFIELGFPCEIVSNFFSTII